MNHCGQVSIFIIVGIILLSAGILAIYVSTKQQSAETNNPLLDKTANRESVKRYLETCLREKLVGVVRIVALQGGYYKANEVPSQDLLNVTFPLYWDRGTAHVPQKNTIQQEIERGLNESATECTEALGAFKERGYSISHNTPKADVSLHGSKTEATVSMDLSMSRDQSIFTIEHIQVTSETPLYELYTLASNVTERHHQENNSYPLGYIIQQVDKRNMSYSAIHLPAGHVMLAFNKRNHSLVYSMLLRYDWNTSTQGSVNIEPIPDFLLNVSQELSYTVEAHSSEGDTLHYDDHCPLMDIGMSSGEIHLDPSPQQVGEHHCLIQASDEHGNSAVQFVRIHITDSAEGPTISSIPEQEAQVHERFTYRVNVSAPDADWVILSEDSSLFDIQPNTGIINFTPTMQGNYSIPIQAVTPEGHDVKYLHLEVS